MPSPTYQCTNALLECNMANLVMRLLKLLSRMVLLLNMHSARSQGLSSVPGTHVGRLPLIPTFQSELSKSSFDGNKTKRFSAAGGGSCVYCAHFQSVISELCKFCDATKMCSLIKPCMQICKRSKMSEEIDLSGNFNHTLAAFFPIATTIP